MKRIVAVLLIVILLTPILALASQQDIKSMSDEKLLKLNDAVIAELFSRGKSATIPIGEYIVGKHIPAGEYRAEIVENGILSLAMILTYGDDTDLSLENFITLSEEVPVVGRLVLKAGKRVVISSGNIILSALNGATFTFK